MGWIPAERRISQNAALNLVSRSCSRYRQPFRKPSPVCVTFRAICFIHSPSGASVIPAMLIWRGAIRMNTST